MWTQWVIIMNISVYTQMYAIKNDEKRGRAFESEQGGECVRAWREVREAKINKIENYSSNFRIMILHYCTHCF